MLQFLIIRPDRMGDAIITQVAIEALAKSTPCVIDVFASDYSYQFYNGNPYIRKIYHCNTENKHQMFKYYKSVCANQEYSAIFVLQPRRRLQQLALLNKCKNRFSFFMVYDKRLSSRIFEWTNAVLKKYSFIKFNKHQHEVQNIKNLFAHGLSQMKLPELVPLAMQCSLYSPEIFVAERISGSIIINISGKPAEQKNILPSMLTALLFLLKKSCKIGIVALADDKISAENILKLVTLDNSGLQHPNIEIISDTNIFSVAGKLNSYEYYIGADGGLLHVAAALGMKCIGLYNTSVKEIWHPWTPSQVSLSADISYTISPVDVVNALTELGYDK